MIPRIEASVVRLTVVMARQFAREGRLAEGYTCVLLALIETRRAVGRGVPWANELMERYLRLEEEFVTRYGVPMDY